MNKEPPEISPESLAPTVEAGAGPNKGGAPEPRQPSNGLGAIGTEFRARFEASQQAIASIPPATRLAAAAILIVPAALGFLGQSYLGGIQRQLGIALQGPSGSVDPVTALWWSNDADQRLVIGSQAGAVITVSSQGDVRSTLNGPTSVAAIQTGADGGPVPIWMANRQVTETPSGSLAQAAHSGPETCRSGFVWREDGGPTLVCVTPDSREQAAVDGAGRRFDQGCPTGRVLRNAYLDDDVCVLPEIAAQTLDENERNESRMLLPDAAFGGTRRVQFMDDEGAGVTPGGTITQAAIEGERGMLLLAGQMVIAGERVTTATPAGDSTVKQAVEAPLPTDVIRLAQWSLADGAAVRVNEVGTVEDVRVVALRPGTQTAYVGDGMGSVHEVDASAQMSGTNPTQYLRTLGTQGSAISAISVAAAPVEGMPSIATASDDGTVQVWWPERAASTDGPSLSAPASWRISQPGSRWSLRPNPPGGDSSMLAVSTANPADAVVVSSDGGVTVITAPNLSDAADFPIGELTAPFSSTPDGRWIAAYQPSTRSIALFEAFSPTPIQSIALTHGAPLRTEVSPSGEEIAVIHSDGTVIIAALPLGTQTELSLPSAARYAAFNPSGTQLAIGLDDGSIALVRTEDKTLLEVLLPLETASPPGVLQGPVSSQALDVRYSASGRQLILFDPRVAETATYGIRMRLQSDWRQLNQRAVTAGQLSADGKRAVTLGADGELHIYDVETGTYLGSINAAGASSWAISPDAGVIAVAASDGVAVYVEEPDATAEGPPPSPANDGLRLSADGSTLLVRNAAGRLTVWSLRDDGRPEVLVGDLAPDLGTTGAEIAPNGRFVIVSDRTGGVYLIELPGLRRVRIAGHGSLVHRLLLSADGKLLASASIDGVVQVTDIDRARQLGALPLVALPIGRSPEPLEPNMLPAEPATIEPRVQQWLDREGYGPVPVDGVLGIATRAAIARWQRQNGRPETGLPDDVLLSQATPRASAS